jgi:PLP dependent protein
MTESLSTRLDSGRLRDRYRRLKERIAAAADNAGRDPHSVGIVAATDHATPDQLRQLVELGQLDLGERDIQRLPQRAVQLREFLGRKRFLARFRDAAPGEQTGAHTPATPPTADDAVRWHMLEAVPRAKFKTVISLVRMIHGIDNLRMAEDLHGFAARQHDVVAASTTRRGDHETADIEDLPPIEVLLRVNSTRHEKHPGVVAPAAIHLAAQIDTMINLRLRGLCLAPPPDDDTRLLHDAFARCREIFEDIRKEKLGGDGFNILVLGGDSHIETAVAHGGNLVIADVSLFDQMA